MIAPSSTGLRMGQNRPLMAGFFDSQHGVIANEILVSTNSSTRGCSPVLSRKHQWYCWNWPHSGPPLWHPWRRAAVKPWAIGQFFDTRQLYLGFRLIEFDRYPLRTNVEKWMSQAGEITYVFCGCFPFRQPPNLLEPLIHSLAPPKPRSGARPKLVEPTHITTKRATLGSRGSIFLDDHVQNMAGYTKT